MVARSEEKDLKKKRPTSNIQLRTSQLGGRRGSSGWGFGRIDPAFCGAPDEAPDEGWEPLNLEPLNGHGKVFETRDS